MQKRKGRHCRVGIRRKSWRPIRRQKIRIKETHATTAMSLIECHECAGKVSTKAATCPRCGAPVSTSTNLGSRVSNATSRRGNFHPIDLDQAKSDQNETEKRWDWHSFKFVLIILFFVVCWCLGIPLKTNGRGVPVPDFHSQSDNNLPPVSLRSASWEWNRITWHWRVEFGLFAHDIIVNNESNFPLQDVKVEVILAKTNGVPEILNLTADQISAGGSYKWTNAFFDSRSTIILSGSMAHISDKSHAQSAAKDPAG